VIEGQLIVFLGQCEALLTHLHELKAGQEARRSPILCQDQSPLIDDENWLLEGVQETLTDR
jgi:hypothetical protein